MEEWIARYGYLAILVGCILEGETTILIGAIFAKFGYLSLGQVMVFSFLGTFLGDSVFFLLGRYFGRSLIERFKPLERRTDLARRIIHKYGNLIVVVMRLFAGFRAAILVLLGCSHFRGSRFMILDCLATGGWAVLVSLLGYSFANVVYIFVSDVKGYERVIVTAVAVFIALIILFYRHTVKEKEEEGFYGD